MRHKLEFSKITKQILNQKSTKRVYTMMVTAKKKFLSGVFSKSTVSNIMYGKSARVEDVLTSV